MRHHRCRRHRRHHCPDPAPSPHPLGHPQVQLAPGRGALPARDRRRRHQRRRRGQSSQGPRARLRVLVRDRAEHLRRGHGHRGLARARHAPARARRVLSGQSPRRARRARGRRRHDRRTPHLRAAALHAVRARGAAVHGAHLRQRGGRQRQRADRRRPQRVGLRVRRQPGRRAAARRARAAARVRRPRTRRGHVRARRGVQHHGRRAVALLALHARAGRGHRAPRRREGCVGDPTACGHCHGLAQRVADLAGHGGPPAAGHDGARRALQHRAAELQRGEGEAPPGLPAARGHGGGHPPHRGVVPRGARRGGEEGVRGRGEDWWQACATDDHAEHGDHGILPWSRRIEVTMRSWYGLRVPVRQLRLYAGKGNCIESITDCHFCVSVACAFTSWGIVFFSASPSIAMCLSNRWRGQTNSFQFEVSNLAMAHLRLRPGVVTV